MGGERDVGRGSRCRARGRPGAARGDDRRRLALPAPSGLARPAGLRPLLQRRLEPGPLVRAALPLGPRRVPQHRPRPPSRVVQGYQAVNRAFADAVVEEVERDPEAAVFFHDYHLYVAPRLVRERRPGCDARATSSTSHGRSPITGACSPKPSGERSTTACWRTTWSASTRSAGAGTSSAVARTFSARRATSAPGASPTRAERVFVHARPISVDPAEFAGACRERERARGGDEDRAQAARSS